MIPFLLSTIVPVLNAKWIGKDFLIEEVITDTRILSTSKYCLFVALKGNQFDAHDFFNHIVPNVVVALLVNRQLPLDITQLIVTDTRRALGQLGAWVRQKVSTRVVALTGSSGKTSVKEMTAAILRQRGNVLATEGNFNNDIGVPLTLLRLTPEHDFAVIELGANNFGEIAWTANLVSPETALINNISVAHLANFGSLLGVQQAKSEIFSGLLENGLCIVNDDSYHLPYLKQILGCKNIWRFALTEANGVDFFASNIINEQQGVNFVLHSPLGKCLIRLPLPGRHNVVNALAACALALSVGAELTEVINGLTHLQPVPGRLFPIELRSNQLLLDDSYNANVSSMIAAVQVLADMPGYRIMVVGDMMELGSEEIEYHKQIGNIIALSSINKVLSIGFLSQFISNASSHGEHFQNKKLLITRLMQLLSKQLVVTILVKGSRSSKMEQIVDALKEKVSC